MKKVMVTGASGFVGSSLLRSLAESGFQVIAALRHSSRKVYLGVPDIRVEGLLSDTDWTLALEETEVVIHTAARVHVMNDKAMDPLCEFRKINVEGTLNLARQAVRQGVRRFIFISSIGVNGLETSTKPFDEQCEENPHTAYAVSKSEAETELNRLLTGTQTELVIIRPPLVYGVDAPGNFGRLIRLVALGVPMPLGCINNRRSVVSLENLVSFITLCIEHPLAAGQLFLVSDGEDISSMEIVAALARGMNRKMLILPVPDFLLKFGAELFKKKSLYIQLCCSLQIDSSKARNILGWRPRKNTVEALEEIGRLYVKYVA
ncbi:UDP-glucose 4-epimerase family protein [Microbulbifer spongiae]|uniref:SDR family oxidoreductase n=1 Tax=Microbulbifer spongiae TaxID=2944933 RepID=A0ABY9EJI2_9GAMM|nr:SDR family oxidoreductase [Microbulbifer sp. MI-G]WKD51426.1 SDR family oxidoreductase [Microbulbifer sp. MI-G]